MSNPSKQKGTKFETWCANMALDRGLTAKREPAGARFDITIKGSTGRTIEALVTRPDYGQALATIPYRDFLHLLMAHGDGAHVECKRLAKVALHSIYEDKFGR